MANCVIIPVYKSEPSAFEDIAFSQCLRVLNKHHISIVTHPELDVSYYTNRLKDSNITYTVECFSPLYFKNITGYNFLLLSKEFYNRFRTFEFMLIYQLDCFVFSDDLDYWAGKEFDYIGSPWFSHYIDYAEDRPFWYNGNGGFSLRRISKFLKILNSRLPLNKMPQLINDMRDYPGSPLKKKFLIYLMYLGLDNGTKSIMRKQKYDPAILEAALYDNEERSNEDTIWSKMFKYTRISIKTPDFEEGLGFSFERSPEYLYLQNNNKLPFGCHAWQKYNLDFWRPFVESYGYKVPE